MTGFSAANATALTESSFAAEIGIAVAKKALDNQKQQGEAAISLLDTASQVARQPIQPNKGTALDVTA